MTNKGAKMDKRGKYERTPEIIKKQSEARIAHFDEVGRKVEINQKEDYTSYQREYQKIYRKTHKEYFRAYAKKKWLEKKNKKNAEKIDMTKLNDIQNARNLFVAKGIEFEYKTSAYNEDELKKLADDVTNRIANYLEEMRKENEENDVSKPQH